MEVLRLQTLAEPKLSFSFVGRRDLAFDLVSLKNNLSVILDAFWLQMQSL